LKAAVLTKAGLASLDSFIPLKYSSQVVAGTKYTIVFQIEDEDDVMEVTAVQNLDNEWEILATQAYDIGEKDADDGATALFASLYMIMTVAMVAFS